MNNETYTNEYEGREYTVFVQEIRHPSGEASAWKVSCRVQNRNGEWLPEREEREKGASSKQEAIRIGETLAKVLIDSQR
ncbi:hypothetical protein [Kushneria aurantia]|uniref:DRBM domain-containing protein n=1 Tax=Kushneria aurantia TaxID=504092 RepID=A0ABV6G5L2_9GAMM|nr:hypothetical protein [Kushneria aurantia]